MILGTGLASIARIMNRRGMFPNFTLVDIDDVVLRWAIEFSEPGCTTNMHPFCVDAQVFMKDNNAKYDLIFIDIFNGRTVPGFVTQPLFLQQCRDSLTSRGCLGFNYIINDNETWETDRATFLQIFPDSKIINIEVNRIFIVN